MADEPKQKTPKGLEIPVPKRKDVMDALRKGIQPAMSDGYAATLKLATEEREYLPWVVACYRVALGKDEFTADDVRRELGTWVQLTQLRSRGILAKARETTGGGHTAHYKMPDTDGVGRALRELGLI